MDSINGYTMLISSEKDDFAEDQDSIEKLFYHDTIFAIAKSQRRRRRWL